MSKIIGACGKLFGLLGLCCLSGLLCQNAWAKEYKYFSIDLIDGWYEFKPQFLNERGTYVTILTNQAQDTAITLAATKNPSDLTAPQMVENAQSVVQRMQAKGVAFSTANFDEQQGVFVAAGVNQANQEQWRVVMTQDNQVLYTVLFNGAQVDEASQILNTLKSVAN